MLPKFQELSGAMQNGFEIAEVTFKVGDWEFYNMCMEAE